MRASSTSTHSDPCASGRSGLARRPAPRPGRRRPPDDKRRRAALRSSAAGNRHCSVQGRAFSRSTTSGAIRRASRAASSASSAPIALASSDASPPWPRAARRPSARNAMPCAPDVVIVESDAVRSSETRKRFAHDRSSRLNATATRRHRHPPRYLHRSRRPACPGTGPRAPGPRGRNERRGAA